MDSGERRDETSRSQRASPLFADVDIIMTFPAEAASAIFPQVEAAENSGAGVASDRDESGRHSTRIRRAIRSGRACYSRS